MKESTVLLVTLSVVLSAAAQIALKGGMMSDTVQRSMTAESIAIQVYHIVFNPLVILGLFFYAASAAVWLLVLARIPVSSAYPFVAVAIVLTSLLGRVVYHDQFSPAKIVATLIIVGGVVMMAKA
ncbi:DMT family transporter [Methylobacterium platani]|uniref:EamA domain-containing protein n=2 Tax=Methylobacterium platani TaxID=427683 RepID=A0A179RXD2_9HYPH|nr:hypothetical protein [Methylobacterium platani]KMO13856.1 hypothetical protein SQ03_20945 [Methylobacterium platani JCM 14648]OAS14639.1 hypothetical protein A5481_30200 [Methylobacterium platani]